MADAAGTPPPPEALAAILGPATQVVRRCAIYEQDGSTLYRDQSQVGLLEGSVSVDYTRAERRTAQFTLENKDGSLVHEPDEFWYDKIVKVWRGVSWPGGEWVPQIGEFMLDEIVSQHFPHTIGVTARDYTKKCLQSKFKVPTAFASGQPVEQVIKTIATNAGINPQKMILEVSGQTTAKDWFFESGTERWKAMNDIAVNYGMELYFDANGNLVLRRFKDPSTSPAVMRFHTGEYGNLVGWKKSARDARLYNSVVVTGESANTTPVYGFATNNEPGSPISIDEIGERTMFYTSSFITTIDQATNVARQLLAIHGLEEYDINLSSLVFPHLEAGEIIEFEEPSAGVNDPTRFLYSSFDIPLKLGPMNSVGKRVVIIT